MVLLTAFVYLVFSFEMPEQKFFEGKWINVDYDLAVKQKKDFSELAKISFTHLFFEKEKVSLQYRFEQRSEPAKIHYLDKEKTMFEALNFQFEYQSDTIFMRSKNNKILAKFIKYERRVE
jgi:hypothetical protein